MLYPVRRSLLSLYTMLSPPSQRPSERTLITTAAVALTFIILLTLYNPRSEGVASNRKGTARIPAYHATKSTSSLAQTPGNEQDPVKITADITSPSATSAVDIAISSAPAPPPPNEPRRAFVTFLEADTGAYHDDQAQGSNPDNEDMYFVGVSHRHSNLTSSSY